MAFCVSACLDTIADASGGHEEEVERNYRCEAVERPLSAYSVTLYKDKCGSLWNGRACLNVFERMVPRFVHGVAFLY